MLGAGKSPTEVRDYPVKFIDSDDGVLLLNQQGKFWAVPSREAGLAPGCM